MYMDFHTHGKLAKYLPFSTEYTDWLLREARRAGLDAICLTEHFNTQQFDTLTATSKRGAKRTGRLVFERRGRTRAFFPHGDDIAEGGHVLCVGPMEAIREMKPRLGAAQGQRPVPPGSAVAGTLCRIPGPGGGGPPVPRGRAHPRPAAGAADAL